MTRTAAQEELNRMIPHEYVLKSRILNLMEQYAETAFKAGMQSKATDYESWATKKKSRTQTGSGKI